MPPKSTAARKSKIVEAVPVVEAVPASRNRWVDIDEAYYQNFIHSSSSFPSSSSMEEQPGSPEVVSSRRSPEEEWEIFCRRSPHPMDFNTCNHRDFIIMEYCFVFLCLSRECEFTFLQASSIQDWIQALFDQFCSPQASFEITSTTVIVYLTTKVSL